MTDPRHPSIPDPSADDGADETLDPALLADLRRAWQELPTPEAAPELDDADPLTREVVAWMADAYRAQRPALSGPTLPLRQRWRLGWQRWRRQAVAAALLIGLGLAVASWPERSAPAPTRVPDQLAGVDEPAAPEPQAPDGAPTPERSDPGGELAVQAPSDEPADAPAPAPTDPLTSPPRDEPRLVAVSDDHVSLRAGAVRLVLITNPASAE